MAHNCKNCPQSGKCDIEKSIIAFRETFKKGGADGVASAFIAQLSMSDDHHDIAPVYEGMMQVMSDNYNEHNISVRAFHKKIFDVCQSEATKDRFKVLMDKTFKKYVESAASVYRVTVLGAASDFLVSHNEVIQGGLLNPPKSGLH